MSIPWTFNHPKLHHAVSLSSLARSGPAKNDQRFVMNIHFTTCVLLHASADGKKVISHSLTKNIAFVCSIDPLIWMLGPSTMTVNGLSLVNQSVYFKVPAPLKTTIF